MSERLTDAAIREAQARAEPIAEAIRTQDNAITAHPYFAVYEGNPHSQPKWWRFQSAFLTRAGAQRYIDENAHNLNRPFVYVESAHRNMDIRAARQAFEDLPRIAAEALARGEEIERLRAAAIPEDAVREAVAKVINEVGGAWMVEADYEDSVERVITIAKAAALRGAS